MQQYLQASEMLNFTPTLALISRVVLTSEKESFIITLFDSCFSPSEFNCGENTALKNLDNWVMKQTTLYEVVNGELKAFAFYEPVYNTF